jgi:hypothetical protein
MQVRSRLNQKLEPLNLPTRQRPPGLFQQKAGQPQSVCGKGQDALVFAACLVARSSREITDGK